jgi:CRP-like cAMP-binding protein
VLIGTGSRCRSARQAIDPLGSGGGTHGVLIDMLDDIAMSEAQRNVERSNQLLGALETASRELIDPHLEPIKLKLGDIVCEAGGLLKHAYFPEGAVLSLLTVLENGSAIETANIGREGAFGLFAAMYSRVSFNRCLVQLEGNMVRCPIELLRSEFSRSEHVRNLFVSYSETLLSQIQQTVACNAMHTTEEKMCRWLLMMYDRAEGEILPYTHEFLSLMLGANRKSITLAAQSLQDAGFISYHRGKIQILNRPGLEKASCECLCDRKGAVRCLLDAALNCGSGRYPRATQEIRTRGALATC